MSALNAPGTFSEFSKEPINLCVQLHWCYSNSIQCTCVPNVNVRECGCVCVLKVPSAKDNGLYVLSYIYIYTHTHSLSLGSFFISIPSLGSYTFFTFATENPVMFHFLTDALYSEDFALGSVSTYILDIPVGCTTAKDRA